MPYLSVIIIGAINWRDNQITRVELLPFDLYDHIGISVSVEAAQNLYVAKSVTSTAPAKPKPSPTMQSAIGPRGARYP